MQYLRILLSSFGEDLKVLLTESKCYHFSIIKVPPQYLYIVDGIRYNLNHCDRAQKPS